MGLGRLGEGIGAVARKGHQGLVKRNASRGTDVERKVPFQRSCCQSAGSGEADARFSTRKGAITSEGTIIVLDEDGQVMTQPETKPFCDGSHKK